jgi:hypothetical protein
MFAAGRISYLDPDRDRSHQEHGRFARRAGLIDFRERATLLKPVSIDPNFSARSRGPLARITKPVYLVDQTPVRVVGTPFVPNTHPRER